MTSDTSGYPLSGKGKKIYIAGPMRDYDKYNFPAFDIAEHALAKEGWLPISPASLDRMYEGWNPYPPEDLEIDYDLKRRVMQRDLACIFECDAIYMLEGWGKSSGARVERALAEFLGLEIYYYNV
jgi:hypothetical protein